ncbi:hypothetical protein ACJIZ3_011331 [Penstemon smallii]|uniref:Uncharacterized protein n=1 Tax=Penstemon smallii TaxID=265156 RepID=A0ABD3UIU2_9LAMI
MNFLIGAQPSNAIQNLEPKSDRLSACPIFMLGNQISDPSY